MLDRFWHEIPPVTRLIMTMQLLGLAIHSLGYAERYDLYFNLDKIIWEGQVLTKLGRSGGCLHVSSSSNDSTSMLSSRSCSCKCVAMLATIF
jgi:hypothetical protein